MLIFNINLSMDPIVICASIFGVISFIMMFIMILKSSAELLNEIDDNVKVLHELEARNTNRNIGNISNIRNPKLQVIIE